MVFEIQQTGLFFFGQYCITSIVFAIYIFSLIIILLILWLENFFAQESVVE